MNRQSTKFRHVTSKGEVIKVTVENGKFYLGNTDERAEGKMVHHSRIDRTKSKPRVIGLYREHPGDEWSDYAITAEDF